MHTGHTLQDVFLWFLRQGFHNCHCGWLAAPLPPLSHPLVFEPLQRPKHCATLPLPLCVLLAAAEGRIHLGVPTAPLPTHSTVSPSTHSARPSADVPTTEHSRASSWTETRPAAPQGGNMSHDSSTAPQCPLCAISRASPEAVQVLLCSQWACRSL